MSRAHGHQSPRLREHSRTAGVGRTQVVHPRHSSRRSCELSNLLWEGALCWVLVLGGWAGQMTLKLLFLLLSQEVLPLQELLLLQLLPLLLLVQEQLVLLHHSCLLLAAEVWRAVVSAGHRHSRLGSHTGSWGSYRDTGRVLLLARWNQ